MTPTNKLSTVQIALATIGLSTRSAEFRALVGGAFDWEITNSSHGIEMRAFRRGGSPSWSCVIVCAKTNKVLVALIDQGCIELINVYSAMRRHAERKANHEKF